MPPTRREEQISKKEGPTTPTRLPKALPFFDRNAAFLTAALRPAEVPADVARLKDRIRGIVFGKAVGDGVGLATEFMSKQDLTRHYGAGPVRFGLDEEGCEFVADGHRRRFIKNSWTDDTDQALLILDTILETYASDAVEPRDVREELKAKGVTGVEQLETLDPVVFARKLKAWAMNGIPELSKPGMGIGFTVGSVLSHPKFDEDPHQAAMDVQASHNYNLAANGAVMRCAVTAVPGFWDDSFVKRNTEAMARITHADDRCIASCLVVNGLVAWMLRGGADMREGSCRERITRRVNELYDEISTAVRDPSDLRLYLDFALAPSNFTLDPPALSSLEPLELDDRSKIGYTYKCMGSGLWCLMQMADEVDRLGGGDKAEVEQIRAVFKKTIMGLTFEGGDADTNGAVAGALMGCLVGGKGIPTEWSDGLYMKEWLARRVELLTKVVVE
ncbi:hypothetical protein HK101_004277 [Irineochytrium annulatum]|nr:hypothetical protein HK101_004277 [Irineochytrium annulatum]